MQIAATIRRLRPDLKLILGGPHVTLVYSAQKLERKRGIADGRGHRSAAQLEAAFDVLCSGDGELAIFEALKDDAPKVVDGDDPKGGLFLTDRMFSDGPLPARHLVDLQVLSLQHRGPPRDQPDRAARLSVRLRLLRRTQQQEPAADPQPLGRFNPARGRAAAYAARLHRLHVLRRRAQRQPELRRADERAEPICRCGSAPSSGCAAS